MKNKRVLIFAAGLLIFIIANLFLPQTKGIFYFISAPFQKTFWEQGRGLSLFFESLIMPGKLKKENIALNQKIEELLAKEAQIKEIEQENKNLREALELSLQKEFSLVLANVVSKDFNQEFILIDQGKNQGLAKDMAVITSSKSLAGRISETYDNFSRVMLITNPEFSLVGQIQAKEIKGAVKGKGGDSVYFTLVDVQKKIVADDIVATSKLNENFPAAILIGRVKNIERRDIEPFQNADLEPFFKINEIEELFVIVNQR